MHFLHFLNNLIELGRFIFVDFVDEIFPQSRFIGRNDHHFQFINLMELFRFGDSSTGHTRQFLVHTEVILEGYRGVSSGFFFHMHALAVRDFFGFDRLVQTVGIPAAVHHTPGKFIHDDNAAVVDHIFAVLFIKLMCHDRLADIMFPFQLKFMQTLDI